MSRRDFNKSLSKRWETTKKKLEKSLDFYLMELKLNILIPSDNSIELVFFFIKEVDLSEIDQLNVPLDPENSIKEPDDFLPSFTMHASSPSINNLNQDNRVSENPESNPSILFDDLTSLDRKMQQLVDGMHYNKMPAKPKDFFLKKRPGSLELNDINEFSIKKERTRTNKSKQSMMSPTGQSKKTLGDTSPKIVKTYKSYLEKQIELQKTNERTKEKSSGKMSKHKNSSAKAFQYLNVLRKNNEIFVEHETKSEHNSTSSSSLALSKKFLKSSIKSDYIPPCFSNLKHGLIASIFLIYISQIINTFFVVMTYNNLQNSFLDEVKFRRIMPLILRTVNTSYKMILISNGVFDNPNDLLGNYNDLLNLDAQRMMDSVTYLTENRERLFAKTPDLYITEYSFFLDSNNTKKMKLIDALMVYVGKLMNFSNKKKFVINSEDFFFMVKNFENIGAFLKKMNNFQTSNNEIISVLEVECLCLVFIALLFLLFFFIYRMKYYLDCYKYINKIFHMLVYISNEDILKLKNYVTEASLFFKNDKQTKQYLSIKMNSFIDNIHKDRDEKKEKETKIFQRKSKLEQDIKLPFQRFVPFNLLLYLIILAGYIALLSFSNIFTKNLSDKIILKSKINPQEYVDLSICMAYLYDAISENKLNSSYHSFQEKYLLDYYHNKSDNRNMIKLISKDTDEYFGNMFSFYQEEDICQKLFSQNALKYPNFYGKTYFQISNMNLKACYEVLDNGLQNGFFIFI